jgi:hypothetical protein
MSKKHPIPEKYHWIFAIGKIDRRGNVIDFKTPPVIVDSLISMEDYKKLIFGEHVPAECLPVRYFEARQFVVLRPTALHYRAYIREELEKSGMQIEEEFELNNFMKLADSIYLLNPEIPFHWKWRVIMRVLHDTGFQDQNNAVVFLLKSHEEGMNVMDVKKRLRASMGETPVLVRYANKPEIALGIHHLHSPDSERLAIEYNTLMHAKHKTSVFGQTT